MLYDLHLRPINGIWFPETWKLLRDPRRLTPVEFNTVINGITTLMIGTHDKVTVPGFKAHSVWTGLPWDILYQKTAHQDDVLAAKMLGLMAMHAFQIHHDDWCTDKTVYAGHEHSNRFYFLMSAHFALNPP